jgi:hypothetical protein
VPDTWPEGCAARCLPVARRSKGAMLVALPAMKALIALAAMKRRRPMMTLERSPCSASQVIDGLARNAAEEESGIFDAV